MINDAAVGRIFIVRKFVRFKRMFNFARDYSP